MTRLGRCRECGQCGLLDPKAYPLRICASCRSQIVADAKVRRGLIF